MDIYKITEKFYKLENPTGDFKQISAIERVDWIGAVSELLKHGEIKVDHDTDTVSI